MFTRSCIEYAMRPTWLRLRSAEISSGLSSPICGLSMPEVWGKGGGSSRLAMNRKARLATSPADEARLATERIVLLCVSSHSRGGVLYAQLPDALLQRY